VKIFLDYKFFFKKIRKKRYKKFPGRSFFKKNRDVSFPDSGKLFTKKPLCIFYKKTGHAKNK